MGMADDSRRRWEYLVGFLVQTLGVVVCSLMFLGALLAVRDGSYGKAFVLLPLAAIYGGGVILFGAACRKSSGLAILALGFIAIVTAVGVVYISTQTLRPRDRTVTAVLLLVLTLAVLGVFLIFKGVFLYMKERREKK